MVYLVSGYLFTKKERTSVGPRKRVGGAKSSRALERFQGMIEYRKGLFGVPALFHFHGSVLPRCVLPGLLSAAITACIRWIGISTHDLEAQSMWNVESENEYSSYGKGAFASLNVVVGFLLVYRTQQGYARYWQARMAFQRMSAYWGSAFIHACFFAKKAPHRMPMETQEDKERRMRGMLRTANFSKTFFGTALRPVASDTKAGHVRQSLSERKRLMASRVIRRLISRKAALALDGWHQFLLERKRQKLFFVDLMSKVKVRKEAEAFGKWSEYVKQQNPHRFFDDVMHLASLLHACACMNLRWDVDFNANLIAFDPDNPESCPPSPAHVNAAGRRTLTEVLLDVSMCRNTSDRRHRHYNATAKLGVIYGISQQETEALNRSHNACHTVLCWLTSTVARRYKTDVFVDAPITSRIFHELNQGHMAFMEAHALTSTPYPLPLAQMTNFVTFIFTFLLAPIQFAATVENLVWATGLNFFCTLLFMGVSEVARELEDPFVGQPNDLPLSFLHADLNLALIDLIKEPWPHRHSDVSAAVANTQIPTRTPSRDSGSTPNGPKVGLRRSLTIAENLLVDSEDSEEEWQTHGQERSAHLRNFSLRSLPAPLPSQTHVEDKVEPQVSLPGEIYANVELHGNGQAGVSPGNNYPVVEQVEEHVPTGVPRTLPPPVRAKYQRSRPSLRAVVAAAEVSNHMAKELKQDSLSALNS